MKWAVLQSQFFADHPPPREFFELHLGAFPWNEEVLPVYAWENQIYIAAANPGAITEMMSAWPENWVLMQAEAEPLRELWRSWNGGEAEVGDESNPFDSEPRSMSFEDSTQPRIPFEMNEDTSPPVEMPRLPSDERAEAAEAAFADSVEATPPPTAPLPDFQPAGPGDTPPEFNPEDFLQEMNVAPDAAPVVAATSVAEAELDLTGGFPDPEASETPPAEDEGLTPPRDESEMDGAPEGFEAGGTIVPAATPPPAPSLSDEFSGIETISAETGSAQVSLSQLQKGPAEDGGAARIPNAVPKMKAAPGIPAAAPGGMSKLDPPPAAADRGRAPAAGPMVPRAPSAKPVGGPAPAAAAVKPKSAPAKAPPSGAPKAEPPVEAAEAPAENAEPTTTFHGLKVTAETKNQLAQLPEAFTGALLASKAGNSLRVIATSKPEMGSPAAEKDFSLGTPSPFRIVLRTEKSYHGYLINSPYLDQFFQSWNGGQYPEHLTVAPLVSGGNILGFVIAFGTAAAAGKANLAAVEKLTQDLVRNWPAAPQAAPKTKAG